MSKNKDEKLFRKKPGQPLAYKLRKRLLIGLAMSTSIVGLLVGVLIPVSFSLWIQFIALILLAGIYFFLESKSSYSPRNLYLGLLAEERIGDAIHWALTAPNCAAAYNVKLPKIWGDIDSLVLTGSTLWIIEIKAGRLPPHRFGKTLRRLKKYTDILKKQFKDFNIRTILTIESLTVDSKHRREYKDDIQVLSREQLSKELRKATQAALKEDSPEIRELAKKIHRWSYSQGH